METPPELTHAFVLELKILPMDPAADLLDQASQADGARIRYVRRRGWVSTPQNPAPPHEISYPVTAPTSRSIPPNGICATAFPREFASMGIPVHGGPGPAALVDGEMAKRNQYLTTVMRVVPRGSYCQVLGTLTFGNPNGTEKEQWDVQVEPDLGSLPTWILGDACRGIPNFPKGTKGIQADFWSHTPPRSHEMNDENYTINYGDGGLAHYRLFSDFVHLPPFQPKDGPQENSNQGWFNFIFGVAYDVSKHFERVPHSDIPRASARHPDIWSKETPAITILLTDIRGYITFGKRTVFPETQHPWCTYIPVVGEQWTVASTKKELNGEEYVYIGGEAEFDTGAAFCYMNQDFVDKFYAFIPDFITRQAYENNPNRKIYYIPANFSEMPSVKFDLGGQMFTLEHLYLPGTIKYSRDGKGYYVGAIQSKTALFPDGLGDYNGPDVIGRT
ncbi:hypothetical protein DFH07DRAFT_781272 [Mycena maculata]|uniref:Peptidase A1 domain-containing protein n=1 Tax=Mycena maculata TaxID=230809 RepID=A0AAD7HYV4_9AGAR|nr:hypothetical protein DFH07DRAFT_781272 [Mycena maculata]